jgi:hypothetical protein
MSSDDLHVKRENEEEYFHKQDLELIEKMRKAAAAERSRRDLGARTGLTEPDLLKDVEQLGFTLDTIALLPLVPVLQVAWAEGRVTSAERALIEDLAKHRGVTKNSPAGRQLAVWLEMRPPQSVFTRAMRLIRAMLAAGAQETHDLTADDLVKYCERIAAASGGILGIHKVSSEERAALVEIEAALRGRPQP